jgi:hypothetical protein
VFGITVLPATLTITAPSHTRRYGEPNPVLGVGAITGFVNGDLPNLVSGTGTATIAATIESPPGVYPITCTEDLAAANYTFVYRPGALTIL